MKNTVVVVTGASAGVGRAAVRAFAREGASLGLLARGADGLEAARIEVEEAGGRALAIPTDVARPGEVESAAARIEEALGPIDVWVNNAMVTVFAPFHELEPGEYHRVTEVTYLGTVHGTMAALRRMRSRNRGTIVQVGSALAYRSIPLQSAYCGAKAAIRGFTDSLRCELHHDGSEVRLTMVHLPAVNTPQFTWCRSKMPNHPQPVPPIYEPEVAAEAILDAVRDPRREVFVGGPTFQAILGTETAPGLLDRWLGATGYESQQTDEPVDPARPDNLFEPIPGDRGAHGPFGGTGSLPRWRAWTGVHAGAVGSALAATASLAAGVRGLWRRRKAT